MLERWRRAGVQRPPYGGHCAACFSAGKERKLELECNDYIVIFKTVSKAAQKYLLIVLTSMIDQDAVLFGGLHSVWRDRTRGKLIVGVFDVGDGGRRCGGRQE